MKHDCKCGAWVKGECHCVTPFQKFWSGGVNTYDMPKSHIAVDAWNAALYTAKERLRAHGETAAEELLDRLLEED